MMSSMTETELCAAIEAILFAASDVVSVTDLVSSLPGVTREEAEAQLERIREKIASSFGGFTLESVAGGVRLATRPETDPYLRKFFSRRNETRLSIAALETLSIVAYRQPITSPEVAEIRGVNSSGVLRTLLERKLVRIAGRKNVVGSPFLYRTTKDFLVHFGLESIQDLPELEEFAEILGESVQDELFNVVGGDAGGDDMTAAAEPAAEENEAEASETEAESSEAQTTDAEPIDADTTGTATIGTDAREPRGSIGETDDDEARAAEESGVDASDDEVSTRGSSTPID